MKELVEVIARALVDHFSLVDRSFPSRRLDCAGLAWKEAGSELGQDHEW